MFLEIIQKKNVVLQDYRTNGSRKNHHKILIKFHIQNSLEHCQ